VRLREKKKTLNEKLKPGIKKNVLHQDFEGNDRKISLLGQQTQAATGENSPMAQRQQDVRGGYYSVGRPLLPSEDSVPTCTGDTPFGSAVRNFSPWMGRGKLKWRILWLSSMYITRFGMAAGHNSGTICRPLQRLVGNSCMVVCLLPWPSLLKCS